MRSVVFAGHGAFNAITDRSNQKFRVPRSMTLVFWVPHGSAFVGSELDKNEPDKLLNYMFQPAVRQTMPRDARHRGAIVVPKGLTVGMPEVIRGGQECWNYRLTPPKGLRLGNRPDDNYFHTVRDRCREEGNFGYRLEWLLREKYYLQCANSEIHWAACRVVKQR